MVELMFDAVMDALRQRLEDHNGRLPANLPKIDVQVVIDAIMIRGATDMDTLRELDRAAFVACGFPDAIAGAAVRLISGGGTAVPGASPVTPAPVNVTVRNVDLAGEIAELGEAELLARYNHAKPGLVGSKLAELSGDQAFLGFDAAGVLDQAASLKRLHALMKGRRVGTTITLTNGSVVRPRAVGESLAETPEIRNPLFPDSTLMDDMECEFTGESWTGVARDVMQLITIESTRPGGRPWGWNVESARLVVQTARTASAFQELSRRYKDAAVKFGEMPAHEREALLTMPTQHSTHPSMGPLGAERGRPFGDEHRRPRTNLPSVRAFNGRSVLSHETLLAVYDVCLRVNAFVSTLTVGLDGEFVAYAPGGASPADQTLSFLGYVNDTPQLPDGSVPMLTVLRNLLLKCGPRQESRVVDSCIRSIELSFAPREASTHTINIQGSNVGAMAIGHNARANAGSYDIK